MTAIPLGRPLPSTSSNQPERQGQRKGLAALNAPRVAPIRFCSRRGLPCRRRCRLRGALLPHPFTLAFPLDGLAASDPAVCFLWRFPWGRPRRTLSGAVSVWSPDFPPSFRRRPSGRLARTHRGKPGPVKTNQTFLGRRGEPLPGLFIEASSELWDVALSGRSASAVLYRLSGVDTSVGGPRGERDGRSKRMTRILALSAALAAAVTVSA